MTLSDFRQVRARIQPHIRITPIVPSEVPNLFLKLENLQHTHSFKARGAYARILELVGTGDKRTVLTVSAGNHGQAIAHAASTYKMPCLVVVPASAPRTKIEAIRRSGAELRIEGSNYDQAEAWTLQLATRTNDYVSPHPEICGRGCACFRGRN